MVKGKKKLFIIPVAAITLIFAVSGCTFKKVELPAPDSSCISDSIIHTVIVTIGDNSFTPAEIEVASGDTIRWVYPSGGTSGHTTTCTGSGGTTLPAGASGWDSGTSTPLLPGDSYDAVITVTGNYKYKCSYHTEMAGTVVVKPRCQ